MQPGVATKRCGRLLPVVLAAACAGAPSYDPGQLSKEQMERCRAAEAAYRANAPEYPALRDELATDPVAVAWLVRMLVRDVFTAREGKPLGDDTQFLRSAAGIEDPLEVRAIAEIRTIGAAAVPTLVGDLLMHAQPHPREVGIELIAAVGQAAVPALRDLARSGEPKQQRAAARALGRIGVDGEVLEMLRALALDSDFTVRADTLRALRGGGVPAQRLLIERLGADDDAFVRRVAAQTLAHFPSRDAGLAVVSYLERCRRDDDRDGERDAHRSLQAMTGTQGLHRPADWRTLVNRLGDLDAAARATDARRQPAPQKP